MLKSLGTEFKVGLFALVALATLGYMFFVLSPDAFNRNEKRTYYTVLRNAAGIVPKTHVMTNGVSIGKVKAIALEANTTRVTLEVEKDVKIPAGSTIEIRSVGLLGDVHLEIVRTEDTGEYVEDNGYIPQSTKSLDMQGLIALVGDIAQDVKKVTNSLANVLGTKEGETSLQNIVSNIEGLTADVKATTATLKKVIGERDEDLNDIVTNLRDGMADLRQFSAGLKDVVNADNRARVDRILASFDETMVDVKSSAKNINLIVDKVERGEGTIGRLVNDDTTLAELEGAIKDIRRVLAPATKLQVVVDYKSEFRHDETSQHFFNMRFHTRPDRFYLVGLTDSAARKVETETTTVQDTNEDGTPRQKTTESIKDESRLKFNLQYGKRWYFTTLRFGLFETTGGLAADFHLLQDRAKFTVEAFDWDTRDKTIRRNAHLKTYATVLFYNHVQILAGIDDITRTDPDTKKVNKDLNYFFGAGLTFNDQDLKAIMGTAALAL